MMKPSLRALLIGASLVALISTAAARNSAAARNQDKESPAAAAKKPPSPLDGSAISRVEPVYPPLAKAARVGGQVVVEVTVDAKGNVIEARAISGHPLLKDAAVAAAMGWKFRPGGAEGEKTVGTLTFTFNSSRSQGGSSGGTDIEQAKQAVKANPRSAKAHYDLAEAYADADRHDEAIAEYEQSLRLKPDDLDALRGLAGSYEGAGKIEEAIGTLRKIVTLAPNDQNSLYSLISKLTSRERYYEAMELQKRICQLEPQNEIALTTLASYAMRAGRHDQAIEAYKKASELNPKAGLPYHGLGAAYFVSGSYEKALESFKQALTVEPTYRQAYRVQYEIGRTSLALGRRAEAIEALQKSVELNPRFAEGYISIAGLNHSTSDFEQAEAMLKKALAVAPTNATALDALGEVYSHVGRLQEGEKFLRDSINANPEFETAHFTLAANLLLQKKTAEADVAMTEVLKTRVSGASAYLALGSLLSHLGDRAAGVIQLKHAYELDPNNHLLLNDLGYMMLEQNEKLDEALKMVQRAVDAQPSNGHYIDSLGWAYFKLGKYDLAEKYLLDAARRVTTSAEIREHIGDLYDKQGQAALAKGSWEQALTLYPSREQKERLRAKLAAATRK